MKKIAGLVVILAVLVLCGYYAMGLATERTLKSNIALLNKSNEIHVDIKDYKRSWFKSEALLNWILHVPEQVINLPNNQTKTIAARDLQLAMPLMIYHGPIIIANSQIKFGLGYAHTNLPLPEEFIKEFDQTFSVNSTKPQPEVSLFINYLNHSTVNFILPPFKLEDKKNAAQIFEWKGLDTNVSISGNTLDGDVVINGVTFTDGSMVNVVLGKVTTEYNLYKDKRSLYLGDISTKVPFLSVKDASSTVFQMTDFNFYNKVDIKDDLLGYLLTLSVDQIMAHNKTYGPGHLKLSIKNLDAEVAAKINGYAIQMQQTKDAERQKMSLVILSQLPSLFSKGAVFEISKFDLKMPEGLIEGKALVSLPKDPGLNPFVLIQKITGNAELKVPATVMREVMTQINQTITPPTPPTPPAQQGVAEIVPAEPAATALPKPSPEMQTEEQLKSMLQSGLIVAHDTDYVIQLSFDKGQLMVNSKPFNPAMLKF